MEKPPYDKEGVYVRNGVMYVVGARYVARVSKALASETRARIIEVLSRGRADLDTLSREIGQSKANVSSQVRALEEAGIVRPIYTPGNRGIKKVIELNVRKIVMYLAPEESGG